MRTIQVRVVCAIAIITHIVGFPTFLYAARPVDMSDEQEVLAKKVSAVNKYKQRLAAAKEESVAFASLLGDTPYPYTADANEPYDAQKHDEIGHLVRIVVEYRRSHPEQTHFATEDEKDASYKKMRTAIIGKNAQAVADLILSGSPVNYEYKDEDEYTKPLLKLAVDNCWSAGVPLLLAAGIDITYRSGENGHDALTYATHKKHIEMVSILLAAGASIQGGDAENALTRSVNACWFDHENKTPNAYKKQCEELTPLMRLLIMAKQDSSSLSDNAHYFPKDLKESFLSALEDQSWIEKEVDKQDWKSPDLIERKLLETFLMPAVLQYEVGSFVVVPDGIVSDVIEVARQRRLLAERGVKINMQWAEKWAQKIEAEVSAAKAAAIEQSKKEYDSKKQCLIS